MGNIAPEGSCGTVQLNNYELAKGERLSGSCSYQTKDPELHFFVAIVARECGKWTYKNTKTSFKNKIRKLIVSQPIRLNEQEVHFSIDMSMFRVCSTVLKNDEAYMETYFYVYSYLNNPSQSWKIVKSKKIKFRVLPDIWVQPRQLRKEFTLLANSWCFLSKRSLSISYSLKKLNYTVGENIELKLCVDNQDTKVPIASLRASFILAGKYNGGIQEANYRYEFCKQDLERVNYGTKATYDILIPVNNPLGFRLPNQIQGHHLWLQYYIALSFKLSKICGSSEYEEMILVNIQQ